METPLGSGGPLGASVSRSQEGPNSLAGQDAQEANAGGRKATGTQDDVAALPAAVSGELAGYQAVCLAAKAG
jgi:hypothetical protein